MKTLYWLCRDLRLFSNPALDAALQGSEDLLLVYVDISTKDPQYRPPNKNQRWWLNKSLSCLKENYEKKLGLDLSVCSGDPEEIIPRLCQFHGINRVVTSEIYEPYFQSLYDKIKKLCSTLSVDTNVIQSNYLTSPRHILTPKGTDYRVYTPYKKAVLNALTSEVKCKPSVSGPVVKPIRLRSRGHLQAADATESMEHLWNPGEDGALDAWRNFLPKIYGYAQDRDILFSSGTSRLSPHLHFGEISPVYCYQSLLDTTESLEAGPTVFANELIWRDFAAYVMFHNPHTIFAPFNEKYKEFPWDDSEINHFFKAWSEGRTGIPLVDAGLKELLETGTMHNRVRMVVASLLTKNMNVHWKLGEAFFWKHLMDADLASNIFNWQWVAGCGADAAPFFRIFNPNVQVEKFDPHDLYVNRWLGEKRERDPVVDISVSRKETLCRHKSFFG